MFDYWYVYLVLFLIITLIWNMSRPKTIWNVSRSKTFGRPRTVWDNPNRKIEGYVVFNDLMQTVCYQGRIFRTKRGALRAHKKLVNGALAFGSYSVRYIQ